MSIGLNKKPVQCRTLKEDSLGMRQRQGSQRRDMSNPQARRQSRGLEPIHKEDTYWTLQWTAVLT